MKVSFKQFIEENFRFTLKYHSKLNPKLWKKGNVLKDGIADEVLQKAYEFVGFSSIPSEQIKNVVITGGNVNFNYHKLSDVDCHILVDMAGLDSEDLYRKKVGWNKLHSDDVVAGYPLEMFAGDYHEAWPKGQGFYSVLKNKWIIEPTHLDHIETLEDPFVIKKIEYYIKYIKQLIKSGTEDEIASFKEKLHTGRSAGLHEAGEFSVENVIYKELRNRNWIAKLNDKYHELV